MADNHHDDHDQEPELAEVRYLPNTATTTGTDHTEPEGEVLEGEVLDEEEFRHLAYPTQREQAIERWKGYRHDVEVAYRASKTVATHQHTKTLARHAFGYPVAGVKVVYQQWRDTHGASRYERRMRDAEATGDEERLRYWQEADVAEKQRRHQRVMDWLAAPGQWIKAGAIGLAGLTGVLLALGMLLAVNSGEIADVIGPISAVINAIAFLVWFVTAYGAFLLLAGTGAGLFYLYAQGRAHAEMPQWLAPAEPGEGKGKVPDEGAILNALRDLGLPALNRKFKEGWQPRWVLGTGRDGQGWRTQLELPLGVTVEKINDNKDVLAHNLVRKPNEVWPTEPRTQPGVLDLWVADQGVLTRPVAPWPLLDEGTTDYFTGVPVGTDQRGEQVTGKLMACNYTIGGTMGSGKTSLIINLLLGAMLDPLVDIDVYVMAFNVDYDPMKPRLRTLVKGDEDEQILATLDALRELRGEVSTRGKILESLGGEETKLTRAIAERDPRMRPRVVVVDECHELFEHPEYGDEAKELATKLTKKARKTGITVLWATPSPSAASLPRDIAKTTSHQVAFAIGDHQGNDAILGTGSHKAGITATSLIPGEDVGTAMARGFRREAGLLRCHHIRKDKDIDQISPVVARAVELRADANLTALTPAADDSTEGELDPLADIAAVLGDAPKMRTQAVLQALTERNRTAYRDWTFTTLSAYLTQHDAPPYKTGGAMHVHTTTIRQALTERDHAGHGDQPDEDDEI